MHMTDGQTRLEAAGCWLSEKAADSSAHPFAQIGLVLLCALWFAFAWRVDWLTAGLSILAITLTQMVLNQQNRREKDAHRRDVARHAKLDELLIASRRARDEIAGIEELEEEEIERLKEAGRIASLRPGLRKAAR
ncbi:MAG TPA: low affinity iron permease family protein [Allosphingosinicella sp.]|jgi:low affinity Fe/Cu permease